MIIKFEKPVIKNHYYQLFTGNHYLSSILPASPQSLEKKPKSGSSRVPIRTPLSRN